MAAAAPADLLRRGRLRTILDAADADGALTAEPQARSEAVAMAEGSWYAHALGGQTVAGDP